jgi:hypothetical protein
MNPKKRKPLSSLAVPLILCLCMFGLVALEKVIAEEALSETKAYYIVREGDTLWDITDHFYEDPYLWPAVWSHNDHIANPHWIYPGDPIYLASIAGRYLADASVAPGGAAAVRPVPSALPSVSTLFISRRVADTALLSAADTGKTGRVLAARDDKVMLAQGDEVYVQLPDNVDASYTGPYQILRGLREIRHPQTKKKMGTLYGILGYVRAVGQPQDGVSRGMIIISQYAVEAGDLIRKGAPPPKEIYSNPSERELDGYVVAGLRTDDLLAEYDVVFLDKGVEEGVREGDTFWVLEPVREVKNPSGPGKITLPETRLAVVVVIQAEKETSTALVTNAQGVFSVGSRVRSRTQ